MAITIASSALAASQGQLGPSSSGTIQISLSKELTLKVASVVTVNTKAFAQEISICMAPRSTGIIEIGFVTGTDVHPLALAPTQQRMNNCLGESRVFTLPNGSRQDDEPLVLVASPI